MLPPVLEKIAEERRGMVLCTGTTGSGKSTTLAAVVDHMEARRKRRIWMFVSSSVLLVALAAAGYKICSDDVTVVGALGDS